MLDSLFTTAPDQSVSISYQTALISILVSLILGLVISFIYMYSDKDKRYSVKFAFSLVLLPAVVAIVIMLVGSNIARAFSMAGAFALVRFRSVPGDSKDISTVFFAMSIGLATGLGYIYFAVIATVIIGAVYFILRRIEYGSFGANTKILKITIPENMNYQGAFDDLFSEYTSGTKLDMVRTTNMGSLFELTYIVRMKKNADEKKFIDEIRCRNGNLNIVLCMDSLQREML